MARRICVVTSIFHGFGKIGGFGTMSKSLALNLVRSGWEVVVAVPRRPGQQCVTEVGGFRVLGLGMAQMVNPAVYREIDADIYHSQSPSLMSTAAMVGRPGARHVVTCRDPRNFREWLVEIRDATWKRRMRNVALMPFEEGPVVAATLRRADRLAYAAHFLKDHIVAMYRPDRPPVFLPNIEDVPPAVPAKSEGPTVFFVGRLDVRKRPELFIALAPLFPQVEFLLMGRAEEARRQAALEALAGPHPNLRMLGFVDKFDDPEFYSVYDRSWILVNTASREAHPLTFFEAAGRGCAILSYVNPDDFATRFGFWASDADFGGGLRALLTDGLWRRQGAKGHAYVKEQNDTETALRAHLDLYEEVLSAPCRSRTAAFRAGHG